MMDYAIYVILLFDSVLFLLIGWKMGTKVNPEIYFSDKAKKNKIVEEVDQFDEEALDFE